MYPLPSTWAVSLRRQGPPEARGSTASFRGTSCHHGRVRWRYIATRRLRGWCLALSRVRKEVWGVMAVLAFGAGQILLYVPAVRESRELDRRGLRAEAVVVASELRALPCTDSGCQDGMKVTVAFVDDEGVPRRAWNEGG